MEGCFFCKSFFRVAWETKFGEQVAVCGSHPALGNWDTSKAHVLSTRDDLYPCWFSAEPVFLPLRQLCHYKYILLDESGALIDWEKRDADRVVSPTGVEMTIEDDDGYFRRVAASHHPRLGIDSGQATQGTEQALPVEVKMDAEALRQLDDLFNCPAIDEHDSLSIVSFELPLRVVRRADGTLEVTKRKSMLIPTLYELRSRVRIPVRFIGWSGLWSVSEEEERAVTQLLEDHGCIPVFPRDEDLTKFLGFCHSYIWPLFHSALALEKQDMHQSQQPFDTEAWSCYQRMNRLIAETTCQNTHESELIWVHDLQLLLLPSSLLRKMRRANIGFFLHTPFPSSEIFRCIPVREEILRSLLCADLVGFHFFEYARHFLVSAKRLLGADHSFRVGGILTVEYGGREVLVRIGHVHLQYDMVRQLIENAPAVGTYAEGIRKLHGDKFIFASVDRCEPLAGLVLKIRGFEHYLESFPDARKKVVLVQYAYPTGTTKEDIEMATTLRTLVTNVNSRFPKERPITLEIKEVSAELKYGLFTAADGILDTSIRDGLNLNPFQYICCRKTRPGTLVLSEFSGCARALASAHRVNPWSREEIAAAMDKALQGVTDHAVRFQRDEAYISKNSTLQWAEEFLLDLKRARKKDDKIYMSCGLGNTYRVLGLDRVFSHLDVEQVTTAFRKSRNRVFFFDHEGTLAPDRRHLAASVADTELLAAQGNPPGDTVKDCIRALLDDSRNIVVVLSGRDRHLLTEWFSDIQGIGLCAEHGFDFKVPQLTGDEWLTMSTVNNFAWKEVVLDLMKHYVRRTQGAFVENKGSALVFQYRDADPDFGAWQAKELQSYLRDMLFGSPVAVVAGKGYVEVKLQAVSKGRAVDALLRKLANVRGEADFVICIGDDRSDEDMFVVVNDRYPDDASDGGGEGSLRPSADVTASAGPSVIRRSGEEKAASMAWSASEAHYQRAPSVEESNPPLLERNQSEDIAKGTRNRTSVGVRGAGRSQGASRQGSTAIFTVTVGKKPTRARYFVNDVDEVTELLEVLRQVAVHR